MAPIVAPNQAEKMAADVETLRKEVTERKGAMEEEKNFGEARRMEQLKGNLNAGQQTLL